MPIKILTPKVVSLIAAGEVVERPASVIKELVENSLDAGSTQISVEAEGGGVNLLRVTDNGSGIPPEEVELAFSRHATSKISGVADLESILSLGFRGEALSSIGAVADVEIVTCVAGASGGISLALGGGVITGRGSQGRSPGTTITVRNLFRRVPARLKFLKARATENSHIANVVSRYALIFPEVRFTLSIDGRVTLRTPGSGQLIDSIAQVYGLEVAQHMMEIKPQDWGSGEGDLALPQVTGMVGSPKVSRGSRAYLNLFVNRRWINHRYLSWAVEEAYHGLLMVGKHPAAVINLSLSPQDVDVNVHPTKSEVKFRDEKAVISAVQKAVRRTLVEQAPVPRVEEVSGARGVASKVPPPPLMWPTAASQSAPASSHSAGPETPGMTLPVLRVVGQLLKSYIIAEGESGLYIIDQHAAHERIRFEEIKLQRSKREIELQPLLEPAPFDLSPRQVAVMTAHIENLAGFGFSIEPFGERTFLVRAVPGWLAGGNWRDMITGLLDGEGGEDWEERIAVSLACHSAIRAGQVLTMDEMREMIRQLEQVSLPNTCPHGRPTMIYLGAAQLEREFGRI